LERRKRSSWVDAADDIPLLRVRGNNALSTASAGITAPAGRIAPEKGVLEAIEVATRTRRRLVMAAKVYERDEVALFDTAVKPAIDAGVVDLAGRGLDPGEGPG
jgi:hypothetical protein